MADTFFQGGDAFQNDEHIVESGDHAFIYQSARLGNFCYRVNNIPPGDYYVDLHIVEIINTYGPKGMRVFNVFMQEEKRGPFQAQGERVSARRRGFHL